MQVTPALTLPLFQTSLPTNLNKLYICRSAKPVLLLPFVAVLVLTAREQDVQDPFRASSLQTASARWQRQRRLCISPSHGSLPAGASLSPCWLFR